MHSCKKDSDKINCDVLKQAIAESQTEALKTEIDKMISSLNLSTSADYADQEQNMNKFVNKLKECEGTEASVICIWCIDTLPEQSEISLKFIWNGNEVIKVIDLIKTADNRFRFAAIHE